MRLECGNCYAVSDGTSGDVCPACEGGHLGVWERECENCGGAMYYVDGWWHRGSDSEWCECVACGEPITEYDGVMVHKGGDVSCPHWFDY